MHMKIVKIDLVQIQEIYDNYLVNDFIVDEVKPFDEIKRMFQDNKYEGYAYYDGNDLIAYAFIAFDDDIALLDYFACIYRNRGYGSLFINELKKIYEDKIMVVECEKIIDNDVIQEKRLHFYLKNDFVLTDISLNLYYVDYVILSSKEDKELKNYLLKMYKYMMGSKLNRVCKFYDR